jgi:hypothetical protein
MPRWQIAVSAGRAWCHLHRLTNVHPPTSRLHDMNRYDGDIFHIIGRFGHWAWAHPSCCLVSCLKLTKLIDTCGASCICTLFIGHSLGFLHIYILFIFHILDRVSPIVPPAESLFSVALIQSKDCHHITHHLSPSPTNPTHDKHGADSTTVQLNQK